MDWRMGRWKRGEVGDVVGADAGPSPGAAPEESWDDVVAAGGGHNWGRVWWLLRGRDQRALRVVVSSMCAGGEGA